MDGNNRAVCIFPMMWRMSKRSSTTSPSSTLPLSMGATVKQKIGTDNNGTVSPGSNTHSPTTSTLSRFLRRRGSRGWKLLLGKRKGGREVAAEEGNSKETPCKKSSGDVQLLTSLKERLLQLEKATQGLPPGDSVALHQRLMTEKLASLEDRLLTLERQNKAVTNIVLPALMRLVKEASEMSKKSAIQTRSHTSKTPKSRKSPESVAQMLGVSSAGKEAETSPSRRNHSGTVMSSGERKAPTRRRQSSECRIPRRVENASKTSKIPVISHLQSPSISTSSNQPSSSPLSSRKAAAESSRLPILRNSASSSVSSASGKNLLHSSKKSNTVPGTNNPAIRAKFGANIQKQLQSKSIQNPKNKDSSGSTAAETPARGRDEGYSTMSSEALAEQESRPAESTTNNNNNGIPRSSTFTSFNSSSRSKSSNDGNASSQPGVAPGIVTATASVLQPATITTTSDNVRIVRGTPYHINFQPSSTCDLEDENSSSTVLWEDSDDSDILFLPIELSSSGGESESTLVPQTSSTRSSYTSWTTPTPTPTSMAKAAEKSCAREKCSSIKKVMQQGSAADGMIDRPPLASQTHCSSWISADAEEKELVENWMRMENVRNEQSTGEEEWAWDWEGVLKHKETGVSAGSKLICGSGATTATTTANNAATMEMEPKSLAEASGGEMDAELNLNVDGDEAGWKGKCSEIDSSTWTKSTYSEMKKQFEEEAQNSDPPPMDFTVEFYRLASYGSGTSMNKQVGTGMEEKMIQTSDVWSSSGENVSLSTDLFTQCQNCLDVIAKLVSATGIGTESDGYSTDKSLKDEDKILGKEGLASTWLPIPPGKLSTQMESLLEMLSSSESEEVLSSVAKK